MDRKKTYMWYSGATDVTGKALVEALGIEGGTTKPTKAGIQLVIGWGTKIKDDTNLAGKDVFNHPNNIKTNRNKFRAMELMAAGGCNISSFATANQIAAKLADKSMTYPLVGRTNYHQGGKGFWLCLNKTQLDAALQEGAQYFQSYINIVDEYRVHVFDGEVIYGARKTKRDNMKTAFVEQFGAKAANAADKANKPLDKDTVDYVLGNLAGRVMPNPDMVIRSNLRGWKFSKVELKNISKALKEQTVAALKSLNMMFGAVDCCVDENGKVWIIEVNSGPGLEGSTLTAYVEAFGKKIDTFGVPAPAAKPAAAAAAKPAAGVKATPAAAAKAGSAKERLSQRIDVINQMLGVATEDEAKAIESLWAKM